LKSFKALQNHRESAAEVQRRAFPVVSTPTAMGNASSGHATRILRAGVKKLRKCVSSLSDPSAWTMSMGRRVAQNRPPCTTHDVGIIATSIDISSTSHITKPALIAS
jgi:hypothetical protein